MTDESTTTTEKELPPDPDQKNGDRAAWADQAIKEFQSATGTDREDALCDLLCDLMHLCDRDETLGDFEQQLDRARGHYEAETSEEASGQDETAPRPPIIIEVRGGVIQTVLIPPGIAYEFRDYDNQD